MNLVMKNSKAFFLASCVILCLIVSCYCEGEEPQRASPKQCKISINDILFAPSSLTTTAEDNVVMTVYLRTNIKEGDVPTDIQETLDNAERFACLRYKNWGLTVGWQGNMKLDIAEPYAMAIDYKIPLCFGKGDYGFAVDFKYSTKKIQKSSLRRSILDFGVFSVNGLISKEIMSYFEIYGGATANYVYIDASSLIMDSLWKLVPLVGARVSLSNYYDIQLIFELNRGRIDSNSDPIWTWHLGASVGF